MPDSMAAHMLENAVSILASSPFMVSLKGFSSARSSSASASMRAMRSRLSALPRASRTVSATRFSTTSRRTVRPQLRQR